MIINRFEQDRFDVMIEKALKTHCEPVPADFTHRVLSRVEEVSQRRILAHVVLQGRLAIAACIVVAVLAVVVAVVLPEDTAGVFGRLAGGLVDDSVAFVEAMPQAIQALSGQWRLILVSAAAIGFCIYGLVDVFFGDRLRIL